eukprot:jgi/Bigna1/129924/aug1.10_g4632
MQPNNYTTSFVRTLFRENRQNTLDFVRQVVEQTFQIIVFYKNDGKETKSNRKFINILKDLENSKKGLENLKATYHQDSKFKCDLDVVMEKIDNEMAKHQAHKPCCVELLKKGAK